MLLTITTTRDPATDLGFLLHKNPNRLHKYDMNWGVINVVFPEATAARCTVAVLVEVDPVELARNERGPKGGEALLGHYVNDRPYAVSSHMSSAINKVFGTALSGRCKERPELVDLLLPFEVSIPVLPVRGDADLLERLFGPLGYEIDASPLSLDTQFPMWGDSPYVSLTLRVTTQLKALLEHLLVLIPVLDDVKHYWVGSDEIDKLLRRGGEWLTAHPERELITRRYLRHDRALIDQALERLLDDSDSPYVVDESAELEEARVGPLSLNEQRHVAVLDVIGRSNANTVLDLGCGSAKLVQALLRSNVERVVGVDVSHRSLEIGARRLHLDTMTPRQRERVELLHGSLTYRDARFEGFDVAVLMEVIEHLDPSRLESFERVVFQYALPRVVIVTTPNGEYNVRFEGMAPGSMRHHDHRFEWTRAQFESWSKRVAEGHGYKVVLTGIGPEDPDVGTPTQMAVFSR